MIISATGRIRGRGSDIYKWISHLTAEERAAVRRGETVLVPDDNEHYSCVGYKRVVYWRGHYGHCNATPEEVVEARHMESRTGKEGPLKE